MKWLKYIAHPHTYIIFYVVVSLLALIPNGLGWRHQEIGYTREYFLLSALYVLFYLFGYYLPKKIGKPKERKLKGSHVNLFHLVFTICAGFFLLKFIYVGGIPLISDNPYLRTKVGKLGGFVDFPTKAVAFLGVIGYYLYITRKNLLCLIEFIAAMLLNILFAERSLIVFMLIGALMLYVNYFTVNIKTFRIVLISGLLVLFMIGAVQILRLGGKNNLDRSGKKSVYEVAAWVIQGDLTGSQKFGAWVSHKLDGEKLYGRYTFGSYLAVLVPSFENHGAAYLNEKYTHANTAQSAAIPFSYFIDFGYFSLILPFIIGLLSRFFYWKFLSFNSPLFTLAYVAFFFNLIWSVRAGNFPVDTKFIYFMLILLFITNPMLKIKLNREIVQVLRILFLFSLVISFLALLIRW